MPAFISNHISLVNFTLINIALGLSIYLTLATGLLSLSNAGFMAIGAYTWPCSSACCWPYPSA